MNFNAKNFRSLGPDNAPEIKIRTARDSPLILVKGTGDAEYAKSPKEKDALVEQFDVTADLLLWAWVGQWSTDLFQLTAADLDAHYR